MFEEGILLCLFERLMDLLLLLVLLDLLFSYVGLLLVKFLLELNEISKLIFFLLYGLVFFLLKLKLKRLLRLFIKEVLVVMFFFKFEVFFV